MGGTPCLPPAGLFEGGKLIPGYNFLNLSILKLFQESPPIELLLSARSELQIVGAGGYSCWVLVLPDWPLTKATQSKASPDLPAQLGCSPAMSYTQSWDYKSFIINSYDKILMIKFL